VCWWVCEAVKTGGCWGLGWAVCLGLSYTIPASAPYVMTCQEIVSFACDLAAGALLSCEDMCAGFCN
jgi:hypothetical protein